MGEFEGSGFREPQHLARAADGSTVQLTQLLYFIADEADGATPVQGIAERVSARYGKEVPAPVVQKLIDEELRPPGIVARPDGSAVQSNGVDPALALRARSRVVAASAVERLARPFRFLFWPPAVAAFVVAFVAAEVWVFAIHGIGGGLRETLARPAVFLLVFALAFASAAFHEIGHAAACLYGGARPGEMGAGVYLAWPAFYTDVTDAYRLGKVGRLRTDLGGIYFNAIFTVVTAAAFAITRFEPLLLVILAQQFQILSQLLPFVRLDGYYIVSDLTGVPDLFTRLRSILASLVPGREPDAKVRALKPRARRIVTVWVVVTVGLLTVSLGRVALTLPDMYANAFSAVGDHMRTARRGWTDGSLPTILAASLQAVTVLIAPAGLTYVLGRLGRRALARCYTTCRTIARRRTRPAVERSEQAAGSAPRAPCPDVSLDRVGPGELLAVLQPDAGVARRDRAPGVEAGTARSETRPLRRRKRHQDRSQQHTLVLPARTRRALEKRAHDPGRTERERVRALIVLAAADGHGDSEIARLLSVSRGTVTRWRARFEQGGLPSLGDRRRTGTARRRSLAPERDRPGRAARKTSGTPANGRVRHRRQPEAIEHR